MRLRNWIFPWLSAFSIAATANKKVSVSEVNLDSAVEDIQWLGTSHSTVLVRTARGKLYRSTDSGKTWNEILHLLHEAKQRHREHNFEMRDHEEHDDLAVESINVSPLDKFVVLVVTNAKVHFISEDGAHSFHPIDHSRPIHNWIFHKTKHRYALMSTWSEKCDHEEAKGDCNHELLYTKDNGKSFHKVASYVVQYGWGDKESGHEERVYFTHHISKFGMQIRHGGWSKDIEFAYTDDYGNKIHSSVPHGNKFLVSGHYIFVAVAKDHEEQTVKLMVSKDSGKTFHETKIPAQLKHKSYTILDTSEGSVMIHVNHGDSGAISSGNVYVSDSDGIRFSLSLPKNVRTSAGECEYDRVMSLEGIYLANFKDDLTWAAHASNISEAQLAARMEQEAEEEMAIETGVERIHKKTARSNVEDQVRTVVSFDKGGSWQFIPAPKIDSVGKPISCESAASCHLNLHGISNFHRFAPFYSVEAAVGLVMGTGNVGSSLEYESDNVNTYLSRDGGLTWIEAHKGAYIYEYGDHGGLVVMADDVKKTSKVIFSWNEGETWYDFELGGDPISVDNIIIEPTSSTLEFVLYGTKGDKGVLYHLDFSTLGQSQCRGLWAADSVSSDYETWMPSDGRHHEEHCLLGKQSIYTRRKKTSDCFNGKEFQRPISKTNCECNKEDYACDFGFTRDIDSLDCLPEDPTLSVPTCTSSSYFWTHAYRKVPGNSCEGGWKPEHIAVPCPRHSRLSHVSKLVLLIVLTLAVLIAGTTVISQSPEIRSFFHNVGFETCSAVKYSLVATKNAGESCFDSTRQAVFNGYLPTHHVHPKKTDDYPNTIGRTSSAQDKIPYVQTSTVVDRYDSADELSHPGADPGFMLSDSGDSEDEVASRKPGLVSVDLQSASSASQPLAPVQRRQTTGDPEAKVQGEMELL
eukprot:GHVP01012586.1.p1 GENE.GHVP01012586.1~~GHVP01012586.1.p1  ORF type:complete len:916 (+),score=151.78 GHVP01012586.1:372-3119(+)